ncbi:hypothetical protein ACPA9J_31290 [Pseudomonas aeruginosa]
MPSPTRHRSTAVDSRNTQGRLARRKFPRLADLIALRPSEWFSTRHRAERRSPGRRRPRRRRRGRRQRPPAALLGPADRPAVPGNRRQRRHHRSDLVEVAAFHDALRHYAAELPGRLWRETR